ncbi:MAG: hypothetical protein HY758_09735 [Nitrospirae bacterium]|nr:hypothetical protein [Nitrospirota bacterium]
MPMLRSFVWSQPTGYRDATDIRSKELFIKECEKLSCNYVSQISGFNDSNIEHIDHIQLYSIFPLIDWTHCPIHIVHDEKILKIPQVFVSYFSKIINIVETDTFLKSLKKLHYDIQKAWANVKNRLSVSVSFGGLDFKLWDKDKDHLIYSVRLNDNYRAHLKYLKINQSWIAYKIGTHKGMGHG